LDYVSAGKSQQRKANLKKERRVGARMKTLKAHLLQPDYEQLFCGNEGQQEPPSAPRLVEAPAQYETPGLRNGIAHIMTPRTKPVLLPSSDFDFGTAILGWAHDRQPTIEIYVILSDS
jgi:hypothetical protein